MISVLCVDNYDSFVYTIVGYLKHLGAEVTVVRNDEIESFAVGLGGVAVRGDGAAIPQYVWQVLAEFDAVLLSPGPGDPKSAGDMLDVIEACRILRKPMLGVCLGHQGMGVVCGATVAHAPELYHGKTSQIEHDGTGIFAGLPSPMQVCRYHSLAITPDTVPANVRVTAWTTDGVVMAIEHRDAPLFGLQFHPESVLTEHGHKLLAAWLATAGDTDAPARAEGLAPVIARN